MSAPPAQPRRRAMAELLLIGQYWERRRNHSMWQIVQVWRADRQAKLVPAHETDGGQPIIVPFPELARKWTQRTST